jgi:hypothetical protein
LFAFSLISCEKEDGPLLPLQIKIIDIPAEYNGKVGISQLLFYPAYSTTELITNGAVITKLFNTESEIETQPYTKKGEYTVSFEIREEKYGFQFLLAKTNPIKITQKTTTISFNDFIAILEFTPPTGNEGIITMTTEKNGLFEPIVAGIGRIIFDYGNGYPIPNEVPKAMDGAFINWNNGYTLDGKPRPITITGNIVGLLCNDEQLTDIDVSGCRTLEYLGCVNNQLTCLDVSNNTSLKFLFCQGNQITNIYVWRGFDVSNPPVGFVKDDTANYVVKE